MDGSVVGEDGWDDWRGMMEEMTARPPRRELVDISVADEDS